MDCDRCDGEGEIVVCPDDMCRARGSCMHGDGMVTCPDCGGTGTHSEDDQWHPDDTENTND